MRIAASVWRAVRRSAGNLAELLLPSACGACGSGEVAAGGLCESCGRLLLSLVALPYCPRCGATVGLNVPIRPDGCQACPPTLGRFEQVVRLGPYAEPLRSAVRELKYRRREELIGRLGELLGQAVAARTGDQPVELVMPVPMFWRRRLARGFDHARALAGQLARRLDVPLGDELRRVRDTVEQVHLPRTRRIANVRGAFEVHQPAPIAGAHVLLVDDVTTTGATADEASRALLKAGAAHVTLAVVAKAEPPSAYAAGATNA